MRERERVCEVCDRLRRLERGAACSNCWGPRPDSGAPDQPTTQRRPTPRGRPLKPRWARPGDPDIQILDVQPLSAFHRVRQPAQARGLEAMTSTTPSDYEPESNRSADTNASKAIKNEEPETKLPAVSHELETKPSAETNEGELNASAEENGEPPAKKKRNMTE
ncbi:hypothetical protein PGT21_036615 [Puccinia graminis f. sp. tritici]|uniref:Uncharacterized protein n=2 Tax=Puccinia graminis f. sp. tritici TaxID=56615 RepID=H6QV05_PUCGT|nr:uncharacterized protein PGTG_22614 [Puccinia graminis f. sp. tritici CRL 75-36-700-3]EHS62618.1 hypothetical protein PGTG_22614 [Puccinia graminis f. sp. tritici CRL 75-36-700-3]KAA1119965.1 hypothetical protein PGT21_036615 [Puccinia graminis f. sp. tritici]